MDVKYRTVAKNDNAHHPEENEYIPQTKLLKWKNQLLTMYTIIVTFALVTSMCTIDNANEISRLRNITPFNEIDIFSASKTDESAGGKIPLNEVDGATPPVPRESGVMFTIAVGIEGTGHHFLKSLHDKSPDSIKCKLYGINKLITETARMLYLNKEKGDAIFSAPLSQNPNVTALMKGLSSGMREIDKQVRKEAGSRNDTENIVVLMNGIKGAGMMSYPNFRGQDRPLQYPDLDMYYASCDMAGVRCGHVIVTRDPYEVIRSTTVKRHFEKLAHRQMKLASTMLSVIYTQMLQFPERLLACWDYDKFSPHDMTDAGESIGFSSKEYFIQTYESMHKESPGMSEKKKSMVSTEVRPFMDTMIHLNDLVLNTCKEMLNSE